MKYNAYRIFLYILLFFSFAARAQDTLKINRAQCETIFLKENLALMAEKLKIPQAEAMVLQAKLWPNPTLTVDQVNLWATPSQTRGQEVVPPLIGSFGKNLEFGVGLEQLVQTAGKRKKLVALEQVSVEKAKQYFEELLRNLKIEFRNLFTRIRFSRSGNWLKPIKTRSIRAMFPKVNMFG
jgi:cobalt-zinc-cadmium efflux system outer membrane protein